MKKLLVVIAVAGLIAGCHRPESSGQGAPGYENQSTTGSEMSTNRMYQGSSTNNMGTQQQTPPSNMSTNSTNGATSPNAMQNR